MVRSFLLSLKLFGTKRLGCVSLALLCCLLVVAPSAIAATASPLFSRGYTVIPEPQKVTLTGKDLEFSSSWRLDLAPGVKPDAIAVVTPQGALAGALSPGSE